MIATAHFSILLNAPKPELITAPVLYPNMNGEIQIELAAPCAEKLVRVNGELVAITARQRASFEVKRDKSGGPLACWRWKAAKTIDGYGVAGVKYKDKPRNITAHRMAYQLENGPIEGDMWVLHNCPNGDLPECTNPAHLWLGTALDNARDRSKKGRNNSPIGDKHWSRIHPEYVRKGERNNWSKLTKDEVIKIRELYASSGLGQKEIGQMFGITKYAVSLIIRRKNWKHI